MSRSIQWNKEQPMDRQYADARYTTVAISNNDDGYSGLELVCSSKSSVDRVANIIFWDASGQFFVQTFGTDLPLAVLEELIAEAKATITFA